MPSVIVNALIAIGQFVAVNFLGFGVYGPATLAIIGATTVAASVAAAKNLFQIDLPKVDSDASRQTTVRSTVEAQKIIYGEALVSGPVSYVGLQGTNNEDLYQTVVLAGHKVNAITDIHFDDVIITNTAINSGNANGGAVGSGIFSGYATINKHLGLATETADSLFTSAFSVANGTPTSALYTSNHRGDGLAYLAMKWTMNDDSRDTWNKFSPNNVKALVKGKEVYDPRLDTTPGANPENSAYIEYQTNPVNCLIDYLTDSNYGMGISPDKINWPAAVTAANGCDVTVNVPGGTEPRFTCNGVLFATDSHKKNIAKILSSMNGNLSYTNGKYVIKAGIHYPAGSLTLTEDDLAGPIALKTSLERSDRYNTIKGLFIDPAQNHKSTEFPLVQLADAVTRDNNEVLEKEMAFNMTNSSYMAQRLAHKLILLSSQQQILTFPANLSAMKIAVGDRVQVTISELNWEPKEFQCLAWTFSDEGGINLTLREDSSNAYLDPDPSLNEYSTITSTGDITDAFRGVPSPSGLTGSSSESKVFLEWVNPGSPEDFGTIEVWASTVNDINNAATAQIGETDGSQFIHDNLTVNDTWYYWVRAKRNKTNLSVYEPNTTVGVSVAVLATAVDWDNVANPTIGIDINSDTISINTGSATTTTGQDVATSGIEAGTTVTQGGITMNQGGSIKGGQSAYNTGTGFFLGYDSSAYKFSIGNASNEALTFDGTNLAVTGDITATSGTFTGTVNASAGEFTGSVSIGNTGAIYGGTMDEFLKANTSGFFLGYDTDAYKLSVGDSSGEVLTWDGSKLNVEANTVSFSTGGEQDYSSESRYTTSQKSATVVLANNSSYFLFDNRRQDLAFPDFVVSYYLGPLTSGTQSSQANARNGIMGSIQVELFYADASTGSPGTWTSFRSITADSWYTDTGTNYVFSNFRVKDSGSFVASLDTRNGILDDYPTMSPFGDDLDGTSVPVGLVDNDYFINIPISRNTVVFPKGRYFIKVEITVTDGSLVPYPSTGSPTATERRISIPNASSFVHPDFGQSVFVGGAHTTIFTDNNRDNETLIKGGSVYLMSKEGNNADDFDSSAIFFGGRGITGGTGPNSNFGPLHGLYFFNDRDSIGSGSGILGSIGSPDHAMYVPYDGNKLTFEGDANFLDGLYINGVAVTAGGGSGTPGGIDTQVQYNDGGSFGGSANFTFNDTTNTLTVQNLTVSGTTTTVNTDELTVKDPNITLNYSTGDSSSTANNAGITIQDAVNASTDASILWKTAIDTFEFSHGANFGGVISTPQLTNISTSTPDTAGDGRGFSFHYMNTSANPSPAGTDHSLLTMAYSNDWQTQIAQDWRNDGRIFIRGQNNSVWSSWHQVWSADDFPNNSANWDSAYTYSQVGHLPLAGGTLTGNLTVSTTSPIFVIDDSNATTPTNQSGYISFQRQGVEKAWIGYGSTSNDDFTIRNTEGLVSISGGAEVTGGAFSVINSEASFVNNSTGHQYVYIDSGESVADAEDREAGIIWRKGGTNYWETYVPGSGSDYNFYSYKGVRSVLTLYESGNVSIPTGDLTVLGDITATSDLFLRSAGGEAGIYLQDSSASNATAFKIYADVTLATSTLYIDYDPGGSGNNWAFVNGGNFLASGTIFADGAASNSLQWEAAYDYSQIGHLPLADFTKANIDALSIDAGTLDGLAKTGYARLGSAYSDSASNTTRVRVTLPFLTNSNYMIKFTVSWYAGYVQREYVCSGYLYGTTNNWYLPRSVSTGSDANNDVVFGRDTNGYAYVSFPGANYQGVIVHSITAGYVMPTTQIWATGWTITKDNATPNTSASTNIRTFTDAYHPNADALTTTRNIALTGAVTGNVNFNGSANVSIATTATSDPTLTLAGDATGSATFTNLGDATLTVAVADDSHNHVWGNIDGASVSSLDGPRFTTASGYIEFGPANASWAHIYTDRPGFYFNKDLYVNNQRVFHTGYHPNADAWTTSRTLTIGDTGKSVNGSAAVTWTRTEIGITKANIDALNVDADTLDGISGGSFLRSDVSDNYTGNLEIAASSTLPVYSVAALEIRESNRTATTAATQPKISFHWGGVVASQLGMDTSGTLEVLDNPGTGYEQIRAEGYYIGSGTGAYFFSDAAGRIATTSDFYVQATSGNTYLYSTNTYLGNTSGDSIYCRGNTISGNSWSMTGAGVLSTSGTITITGADGENALTLSGASPTVAFTDTTASADNFYIHINSNIFYILADRDGAGAYGTWETPHPLQLEAGTNIGYMFGSRVFRDDYHPNADALTTTRNIALTGAVTGNVNFNGSANVSIATTATSDPTLTLSGAVTGSATFTNLGNATLTVSAAAPLSYIDTAIGNYGTIKVDDDRGVSWAGYAIRDDWVFMSSGAASCGIYNDTNNQWAIKIEQSAAAALYYNGASKFATSSLGVQVDGYHVINQTSSTRDRGVYGTYDPTKIAAIWSMGTAYNIASNGSTGGDLYGLCYSYNPDYQAAGNNPGAIAGLNHQMQWRENGNTQTAIGTGIYTVGNVTAYSDRRVKANIQHIPNALEKVNQINGYTYDRTDLGFDEATGESKTVRQTGVIAQELLEVLPEAVTGSEKDHYAVAYGNMAGLFVEAIKELTAKVEDLEQKLKEKENGNN